MRGELERAKYKRMEVKRWNFSRTQTGLARWSRDITKLLLQGLQHLQVLGLARLGHLRIAYEAARHATAMTSQFAGNLVATHPRAPHRKTARGQRRPRHSHAAANRAEIVVIVWFQ